MALVIIAVAIATSIGLTFLISSTTATRSSQVMVEHSHARYIAESGLAEIVSYLESATTWRADRPQGEWVSNQAFGGGTYSVSVVDGIDTNNDGVIDGDGDFTNNNNDPVTIVVTGKYADASYKLTAAWSPSGGSTVAANESVEIKDKSLVDSYSSRAGAYGGSNVGSAAVVSANGVGAPNISLKDHSLVDGNFLLPSGGNLAYAFKDPYAGHISGSLGTISAAGLDMPNPDVPTLSTNQGDLNYSSGTIVVSSDLWCNKLILSGTARLFVQNNVNIVVDSEFHMKDSAVLALDNPHFGNTDTFPHKDSGVQHIQIASPLTFTQSLTVTSIGAYLNDDNHNVRMAIYTDNSGEPGTLIAQSQKVKDAETSKHWEEVDLDSPVTLAAGTYWVAVAFEDSHQEYYYDDSSAMRYRNNDAVGGNFLSSWGTSDTSLSRNLDVYVAANVAGQGASVTIYSNATTVIESNAKFNANTQDASRAIIYDLDDTDKGEFQVKGNSVSYGTFATTADKLHLQDSAVFSGIAKVSDFKMEKDSVMHIDSSGGAASPGLLVDNTIEMKDNALIDGYNGTLNFACNSVGSGVIVVKDQAALKGDAYGGPDGAGGNVDVHVYSGATMTGVTGNLTSAVDMTLPSTPSIAGSATDLTLDHSKTFTITSDQRIHKLTLTDNGVLTIDGKVNITIEADSQIQKFGQIVLTPGSTLNIYTNNKLDIKDDAQVNYGGDPSDLVIYDSKDHLDFHNRAKMAATLWGPNIDFHVKDDAQWFGSLYVRKLHVEKNGQLHMDQKATGAVRWLTQP